MNEWRYSTAPSILNLGTECPWVIVSRPELFALLEFATEGGIMLRFLAATREFSLLQNRQFGFGSHSSSYSTRICGPFPIVKAAGS